MTNTKPPQQTAELSINQALQQAIAYHQTGNLEEAGQAYLAILQINPSHPDANYNMGILAMQMEQPAAGLPFFMTALDADPTCSQYWLSYIDALFQAGQQEDARQVLALARQQGLQGENVDALAARIKGDEQAGKHHDTESRQAREELHPVSSASPKKDILHHKNTPTPEEINTIVALFNVGRLTEAVTLAREMTVRFPEHEFGWKALGVMYCQMGQSKEALPLLQKAAVLSPCDAEIFSNLGNILSDIGRLDEAEASFRRSLEISPDSAQTYTNLGATLHDLDKLNEAEASYRQALQIEPNLAEAHHNLGNLLKVMGRLNEAETSYRHAVQLKPDYAEAHNNLGLIFHHTGQLNDAKASLERALQIKPDYAEACNNLGLLLRDMDRMDMAIAIFRRALQIKPDIAEIHNNLGSTLRMMGRLEEAKSSIRRALQIKPDFAEAHNNLGTILQLQGRTDEAEASLRRAMEIKPDYTVAYSNLLFSLSHDTTVDAEALFAEHYRFGEQVEAPFRASSPQPANSRDPDRTLQIGFVSADFRNHAVASFIEPLLVHLSGNPQLSLHAYYNYAAEDAITRYIRPHFAHWHSIANLSDADLAEKIRADGIDILIDLSGHTAHNRLATFARKPAPVQVSWMGYPGTTGLRTMDYYLADHFFLPPGQLDEQFTEKIAYIPAGAPFLPSQIAPPVNMLPALDNGYVTFGSFNRQNKFSASVISLWAQLLRALPDSRMLLGGMPEDGQYDPLIKRFEEEGIVRERLSLHARCNMEAYLRLHQQVDICLDTFPYNGGTTTLHALWMGVPTLTLAGSISASRSGAAILGHAGLDAFIAHNAADFVQNGQFWATHLAALSDIRAGLREHFAKSAMCQPATIAAGVERALRIMWQRWCAGLPTESFEVSSQNINNTMCETTK